MTEDWGRVAQVIDNRMRELGLTQQQVAATAQVSLTTLRELQHNINPRKRRPQTLAAVSTALRWSHDHLDRVLTGGGSPPGEIEPGNDPDLSGIRAELTDLRKRVEAIELAQRRG